MIDAVVNLVQYGLIGLAAFLVIGWLGLRIPARPKKPILSTPENPLDLTAIPEDLPRPVARYLQLLFPQGIPNLSPVVAWGTGRITSHLRVFGTVWLPLSWTLYLYPAVGYLWRTNITWYMRPFLKGGDQYLDGHGTYRMGNDTLESEFIDLSEFTILWIHTLVFAPFSLPYTPGLKWQLIDDRSIWLTVTGPNQASYNFKLLFSSSGMLEKIETKRAASRDGTLLDFSTTIVHSPVPESSHLINLKNAWESVVYLDLKSNGIFYDVNIDQVFDEGI